MEEVISERLSMIRHLSAGGCLKTRRIRHAFMDVARHLFVPEGMREHAYADYPLHIGMGQTISAPHMVAIITELLAPRKTDIILEVGAGSGYQAAILSKLARWVYAVELDGTLVEFARENLRRAGITNAEVMHGDGSIGFESAAPYDKIIISCSCEEVPRILFGQLRPGGILIAPVGGLGLQELKLYRKTKSGITEKNHGGCVFVPLRH